MLGDYDVFGKTLSPVEKSIIIENFLIRDEGLIREQGIRFITYYE